MNAFKRLCLFVFSVAGIASLTALLLPWFGPWVEWARSMLSVRWYYITLEVCAGITALGLVICLLRALFTPRNQKHVVVARDGADVITVTTAAISAQAAHIAESRGDFTVERVHVEARRNTVDVFLRVRPTYAMNVAEVGEALHSELVGGLSELAGDTIRSVSIEFVEADSLDAAPVATAAAAASAADVARAGLPESAAAAAPAVQQPGDGSSFEITVPMGRAAGAEASEGGADPDAGAQPAEEADADAPAPEASEPAQPVADPEPEAREEV